MLTILFLGDIVGESGRSAVIARLPELKRELALDFIIVNGENAAAGRGITPKITIDLLRAGVSVITTGDHIWDRKEIVSFIDTEPRLLRPLNYPPGAPGAGTIVLETPKGKVGVINVQARTFMQPILENPFPMLDAAVNEMRAQTSNIIVDAHGETTSEKIAIGRYLDGRVSAVLGTHTHVQTADEQIFEHGTAFICDAGMCGPVHSILGREIEPIVGRFISNLPAAFPVAHGETRLRGVLVEIDETTGRASSIRRIDESGAFVGKRSRIINCGVSLCLPEQFLAAKVPARSYYKGIIYEKSEPFTPSQFFSFSRCFCALRPSRTRRQMPTTSPRRGSKRPKPRNGTRRLIPSRRRSRPIQKRRTTTTTSGLLTKTPAS